MPSRVYVEEFRRSGGLRRGSRHKFWHLVGCPNAMGKEHAMAGGEAPRLKRLEPRLSTPALACKNRRRPSTKLSRDELHADALRLWKLGLLPEGPHHAARERARLGCDPGRPVCQRAVRPEISQAQSKGRGADPGARWRPRHRIDPDLRIPRRDVSRSSAGSKGCSPARADAAVEQVRRRRLVRGRHGDQLFGDVSRAHEEHDA